MLRERSGFVLASVYFVPTGCGCAVVTKVSADSVEKDCVRVIRVSVIRPTIPASPFSLPTSCLPCPARQAAVTTGHIHGGQRSGKLCTIDISESKVLLFLSFLFPSPDL